MHFSKAITFIKDNIAALRSIGEGNENKQVYEVLTSQLTPIFKSLKK